MVYSATNNADLPRWPGGLGVQPGLLMLEKYIIITSDEHPMNSSLQMPCDSHHMPLTLKAFKALPRVLDTLAQIGRLIVKVKATGGADATPHTPGTVEGSKMAGKWISTGDIM